ncbi:MAG: ABC transporter substrate-binding protein [Methanimicrococcus sp.]|nr:ABC transporter substrate-binding protein [Methanimicrococcus sp.]
MNHNKRLFLFFALLILVTLMVAGCIDTDGNPDVKRTESQNADVLRLAGGDYGYPQPFSISPRGPGSSKVRMIFDTLLERDEKGSIPWLAESWEISSDGTEYTLYLREGIVWSDGEPFTANDVKFTFDYEQKYIPIAGGMEAGIVDHVQVIDDNTVKFVLIQPFSSFLSKLTSFMIIPEHIYKNVEDPAGFLGKEAVIGTGPFLLDQFHKEHGSYRFISNDKFWGPDTVVETVEFVPVSDEMLSFEQGEIDFASLSPDVFNRFASDKDIRIVQQPAVWAYQLYFNMNKRTELNDVKVRQAFVYAIDREELVEKVGRGAGKPGRMGILPEDHIWYNADQPEYSFNPEMAKKLLDEAGWIDTDGDGIRDKGGKKLSYVLTLSSAEVRIGELLKQRLNDVGIDVQVKALETKSRDSNLNNGDFELAISGYGGWGRDADYLRTRFCNIVSQSESVSSGATVFGYHNDTLNALGVMEQTELDDEKRKAIVFEMQTVLAEDIPAIPLYYTTNHDAWRISKYDGWMNMYDHHARTHSILSYVKREGVAAKR